MAHLPADDFVLLSSAMSLLGIGSDKYSGAYLRKYGFIIRPAWCDSEAYASALQESANFRTIETFIEIESKPAMLP